MLGSNTLRSIGLFAFLAVSLTLAGCSSNSADTDRGANTAAKSEGVLSNVFETAKPVTIPEGTALHIVLDQSLTSNRSHAGDDFEASISEPVVVDGKTVIPKGARRSEEHTSELQSLAYLVCRLLLEKKKKKRRYIT